jgi:hypothetical protein
MSCELCGGDRRAEVGGPNTQFNSWGTSDSLYQNSFQSCDPFVVGAGCPGGVELLAAGGSRVG